MNSTIRFILTLALVIFLAGIGLGFLIGVYYEVLQA